MTPSPPSHAVPTLTRWQIACTFGLGVSSSCAQSLNTVLYGDHDLLAAGRGEPPRPVRHRGLRPARPGRTRQRRRHDLEDQTNEIERKRPETGNTERD